MGKEHFLKRHLAFNMTNIKPNILTMISLQFSKYNSNRNTLNANSTYINAVLKLFLRSRQRIFIQIHMFIYI